LIQRLLERMKLPAVAGRDHGSITGQVVTDSSINRSAGVGSDDSTAIRVRVPSTLDYLPSPVTGSPVPDEPGTSALDSA
jgi:hypothetical protein